MLRSAGFRFLIVGLLALFMFIPLFFVGEIVGERAEYSRRTIEDVGQEWGGRQVIAGPRLVLPLEGPLTRTERREILDPATGLTRIESVDVVEIARRGAIYIYPERFDATITTESEIRHRGLFDVPVYTALADMGFALDPSGAQALLQEGERILWDQAALDLSLTSNRALRGVASLKVGEREVPLEPRAAGETGGIIAALGDPRDLGAMTLKLGFNGAEQLMIAPVGRNSTIEMDSDWPHPSFSGAFLPDGSEVGEDGFSARWTIPHLARALPQMSRDDNDRIARSEALGVRFFQPNDFYQKAYRAARYGILFIALTFLSVLLIENRQGAPAHPVQYILIGLAQSVFVLLMVAYAEQIGFGAAYGLSAGATIALLVLFGAWGLKLGRRTLVLGLMLVVLYGVLYLILQSADYALLAGSTLAFGALAGTMYATRNEDWYGPAKAGPRKPLFGGTRAEEKPEGGAGVVSSDAEPPRLPDQ
ncbi:cell envelope integrity protein CreD [Oceaniglobus trochenteri]|uniref:cell envelope integrity protein CreD n=1 Tax=Oceaniglobus trochenteri TaxID=2763260 RepID=UPI001CFF95C7|nr:cell envelope integrity protein CreD [Oceaniglobus trochenteri]